MAIKSVHLRVRGSVQGVGFRWFTQRTANRLGIAGTVRNLPDGGVEIFAEGETETLKAFVDEVREGPPGAWVREVDEKYGEASGREKSFRITF